ncbi:Fes/CIP4, and EFC/F-BAR homology domain [Rhizoctonia solani]|uniref:Fes/CIP4, and EFC/F-BAR homology domain n=1 Tax=Rhizoctonia solani TaxID=456999 RepID=A0A8H7LXB0_9AGAM|nr:Fes/CIP4, and EFC/F-BAR homology domain [Rhizoctonia solani]
MPEGQPQYPPRTMSLPKGTPPGSPGPGRSPSPTDWGDDIPSFHRPWEPGRRPRTTALTRRLWCSIAPRPNKTIHGLVSGGIHLLRKRAALEDEFGRGLFKLARTTTEVYAMNDGKQAAFDWEMSDELASLAKEVERNRKNAKDLGARYERALQDAETAMEKAKARVSAVTEELERVLVAKEGETMRMQACEAPMEGSLALAGQARLQKQEEDIRARLSMASDGYPSPCSRLKDPPRILQLSAPRILRVRLRSHFTTSANSLPVSQRMCDEIDLGTHIISPDTHGASPVLCLSTPAHFTRPRIKLTIESIDNRTDFKLYMQNYAVAHGAPKGPRREGPAEDATSLPTLDTVQSHLSTSSSVHPSSSVSTSTSSAPSGTPTYPHAQAYGPTQAFPPLQPQPPPAHTPHLGSHLLIWLSEMGQSVQRS